jgi:Tol biopolymer transport system component
MAAHALDRARTRSLRHGLWALVGAALLVACFVPTVPSRADAPSIGPSGFPGLLVFVNRSFDGNPPTIWTVVPGSSDAMEIAHAGVPLIAADISPTGDEIAYDRDADYLYTDARDKLVITRPDGSDGQVVRSACSGQCHWFDELDWAPDGETILMWRCLGACPANGYHSSYAIWSIQRDGTNLQQLTFPGAYTRTSKLNDHSPDVSPDGSSFVFDRLDDITGRFTLEIAPIAGGEPIAIPLPDRLDPGNPIWTPDGSKILFQSPSDLVHNKAINLYTVDPDGTDLQKITDYHVPEGQHFGGVFEPTFSPDGQYIAATHMFSPNGFSYVILSPDGTLVSRIPIEQNATEIEWGPSVDAGAQVAVSG